MDVDELTLRDLRLEAQLSAISKKAVPSMETQKDMPTNILNTTVSDINLRDLGLEEQLQKISRNAMKEEYGFKPTPIKSFVTQEMIQDFQDEMASSFYEDPITGRKLKYVPGTEVQLEDYRPAGVLADVGISEESLRAEQLRLAGERRRNELEMLEIQARLERFKQTAEFKEEQRVGSFYSKQFLLENPDLVLVTPTDYTDYVRQLEREMYDRRARIFELDGEIARIQEMIDVDAQVKSENQAQKDRIDKANRATLEQRSEELNLLNRGRLNIVRQPNESDEDFKQRLVEVGQVEFDEEAITQQAGRRAVTKFKENMKTITRNNALIENMIKSVDPSRLFLYNKYFSAIQAKMKEVYGAATWKEDDYDNLLGIFDNIIGKVGFEPMAQPIIAEPYLPNVPAYGQPNPYVFTEKKLDLPPLPLPPLPSTPVRTAAEEEVEDDTRPPFQPTWVTPRGSSDADTFWGNTTPTLTDEFKDQYRQRTGRTLTGTRVQQFQRVYEAGLLDPPVAPAPQVGVGLQHEKLPKFAHLGKIAIDPHALYYQNTLKILSHNKHHLLGYKNTKVSEDLVSILMDLYKGKFPTGHELKKLDLGEKELYDNIIHLAHLHKKAEHNLPQTRQAMKHRFELLNGEIGAGNTNKALKAEMKQLLHKMAYGGMISHVQVGKYLKSIN
jgi:hypothetical protein